jgi:plastocyanin
MKRGQLTMRRGLLTAIACSPLLIATGCGSLGSPGPRSLTVSSAAVKSTATPNVVSVTYAHIAIHPATLTVKVGTTIRWTNLDSVEHTVTSVSGPQKFNSGTFGEGRSFAIKTIRPGVIRYECRIHPTSMRGTIDVVK